MILTQGRSTRASGAKAATPSLPRAALATIPKLSPREKFLFVVGALQADPPPGFPALLKEPAAMDDATLFVVVMLGLVLIYNQLVLGDGENPSLEFPIDLPQPPVQQAPPVDQPPTQPPISVGQTGSADVVAQAIGDLERAGRSTQGSCGALAITNLVAWRLRPRYGLLRKRGGNRGIPQADGGCLSGDESNDEGFATDYLIDRETFAGYDLLGDGGGANTPQWSGPEDASDILQRNRDNFREPFDPQL